MVVCPYDCHWCDAAGCRAAGCELTADPSLAPCTDCGALVSAAGAIDLCVECMAVYVPDPAEA
jgi:hypothetical protein